MMNEHGLYALPQVPLNPEMPDNNPVTDSEVGQCIGQASSETGVKIAGVFARPKGKTFEQRISEFLATLEKGAKFGAMVDFLDTVNSIEELEKIKKYVIENDVKDEGKPFDLSLFDFYRRNLEKYSAPENVIDDFFRRKYPLTAAKLDTQYKMRIFLRGAEFCGDIYYVARLAEYIISEYEVNGKNHVEINGTPSHYYQQGAPERLAYFTQLQVESLRRLLFPDLKSSGGESIGDSRSSTNIMHFDFRDVAAEKS